MRELLSAGLEGAKQIALRRLAFEIAVRLSRVIRRYGFQAALEYMNDSNTLWSGMTQEDRNEAMRLATQYHQFLKHLTLQDVIKGMEQLLSYPSTRFPELAFIYGILMVSNYHRNWLERSLTELREKLKPGIIIV